jgi:hypothetical protein
MPASLSFPRKRESSNPGGRRSTRGRWLLDRRVKPDDDDWSEGANGTQQHIERTCVALRRRPRLRVAHLRRQGLLACSRLSRRGAPLRRSHGRLARGDRGGAADARRLGRAGRRPQHHGGSESLSRLAQGAPPLPRRKTGMRLPRPSGCVRTCCVGLMP